MAWKTWYAKDRLKTRGKYSINYQGSLDKWMADQGVGIAKMQKNIKSYKICENTWSPMYWKNIAHGRRIWFI